MEMNAEEFKIVENVNAALKCVYELGYFTGKSSADNELKFAIDQIALLVTNGTSGRIPLKAMALQKLRAGQSSAKLKEWLHECKLAMIEAAEDETANLTQACRLMGCYRETVYHARGLSSKSKKR